MSKIQKINIYVGTVGSAYIDKETALKNINLARKNISDVENIISKANDTLGNLENSKAAAEQSWNDANDIKNTLNAHIRNYKNVNSVIYSKLLELKERVETNDNDGIYKNGGNINTAVDNIQNADKQIEEINKIIAAAEVLLEDNKKLLIIRNKEYENAIEEFIQYVPDAEFNIDELSNNEEDYLNNRIDEINDNVNIINDVTDHINELTEEIEHTINDIINGENTDNPTDDEGNKLYWYAGQVMPSKQYYESNNDEFIVTENTVNTWHELTLIKDTRDGEQISKLLANINSLSISTTWYVLVPESIGLNPVMSDIKTVDSRFTPGDNLTRVNGVTYMSYIVNNEISATENTIGSSLNIIMITGYVEEQEQGTNNYWYINYAMPEFPYNPEENLATEDGYGWRKIEGDLNIYNENNPYWGGGDGIVITDETGKLALIDFYVIVPQHTRFKDAIRTIELGYIETLNIQGNTYCVYKLRGLEFNLKLYIDSSYVPVPSTEPDPETYTIVFKNGEETVSTISGVTGTAVEVPTGLSKEGFIFSGWSINGTTIVIPVSNIGTENITYIAVWTENQQKPIQPADIYWYIGLTQPTNNTVISDELAENANSLGWHFIGNTLGTYSAANPLNTNGFLLDENYDDVDNYLALPGSLQVHADLGDAPYTNLGTVTIDEVEYTVYQGEPAGEFNYKIY